MSLLLEPVHLDVLLRALVPRIALQRVVIVQSVRWGHSEVTPADVEQDVGCHRVDVCQRGRRENAQRLGRRSARGEGAGAVGGFGVSLGRGVY
jgi:hypothetical protein